MGIMIIQATLWTISLAALLWSAASDLRRRIIPDELVILVAVSGILLRLVERPGQIWISLIAAGLVFVALGFLCRSGFLGGGDVKLMAAATLMVRPDQAGALLIGIALAGGLLSCLYLGASRAFGPAAPAQGAGAGTPVDGALPAWLRVERMRLAGRRQVPYGAAIAAATVWFIAREISECSFAIPCSF